MATAVVMVSDARHQRYVGLALLYRPPVRHVRGQEHQKTQHLSLVHF